MGTGATSALLFLSLVVLPSFQTMYRGHEDRLPSSTLALLAFGDAARAWGSTALAMALASMLAWRTAWQRLPSVRMPVIVAHTETDRIMAFHNAQELFEAAREPKSLLVLADRPGDGYGGHVNALYDQLDRLRETLVERLYRDARLYPIGGGTREIMNEIIAKVEGY